MVNIVGTTDFGLRRYVETAYAGDEDLLSKYHVSKYDFESAVNETMRMISYTSKGVDMMYFGVTLNDERIGYLCCFKNNLYSFGINIQKRTKEILSEFWGKVKEVLGNSFICMLYPNNTRAINWLKKCKMEEVESEEDNCVTLLYHNLN